jgi:hypothetical protein
MTPSVRIGYHTNKNVEFYVRLMLSMVLWYNIAALLLTGELLASQEIQ